MGSCRAWAAEATNVLEEIGAHCFESFTDHDQPTSLSGIPVRPMTFVLRTTRMHFALDPSPLVHVKCRLAVYKVIQSTHKPLKPVHVVLHSLHEPNISTGAWD